jgi:PadR family transcriptional regulator, regulatory protein PadR
MSSPRFPIPQGTLEPAHGYGIAQRLEQVSRQIVQVNQGSLYPALHRLEQKGWLQADRTQAVERASWDRLTGAVQLIFAERSES